MDTLKEAKSKIKHAYGELLTAETYPKINVSDGRIETVKKIITFLEDALACMQGERDDILEKKETLDRRLAEDDGA